MANESMIAACPKCAARYRLERARLRSEGVRLRCTRCEAVFRVTPPAGVSTPPEVPATPPQAPATPPQAPAAPPQAPAAPPTAEASTSEPSLAASRELPPVAPQVVSPPPEVVSPPPQVASPAPELASPAPQAVSPPLEAVPLAPQRPVAPRQATPPPAVGQSPVPRPDSEGRPAAELEGRDLVLLADSDVDAGKGLASTLASWGLEPLLVHDGVEAILTIQRALPRLVILDAALPKMFGFQVCELMKRNESLRSIHVVLIGAIHHRDRYRRAPSEIYGADAYAERPELPEALRPILSRFGLAAGVPAEMPDSPPAVKTPLVAPDVAPMLDPLIDVEPAPEPTLEVGLDPEPLLELDPAPLLELDPAPEPLVEVAAPNDAISEPELPGLVAASPSLGSEVLAEPVMEPLDAGLDQDFEVLDVDDDSFDEQMPIEPVADDLLAEPIVSAPEPLAEPIVSAPEPLAEPIVSAPEPLVEPIVSAPAPFAEPEPPLAADAIELEPPTAELPVQVQAPEPADDPAVSAAERLARIIVSDVVLYNPEKFEEGVRVGNVVELLDAELEEGRGLFEQRVAPELRTGRDFLADELLRVARSRGMQA